MKKRRLTIFVMGTILLVGCAGQKANRIVGETRPASLSRISMCAVNQELTGKEIYISGEVVALSGGEFLLECQEMKGHRLWVDTAVGHIPSPTTAGQIVGVYGVVTSSTGSNELRLSAKGIEYLGKAQREEESQPSQHRQPSWGGGGSCH